jgi:hypothetical protein
MKTMLTLMHREWLQHRFGWTMLALLPIALALLLTAFGSIAIGDDTLERVGEALPQMLALISIAGTTSAVFLLMWVASLIIVSGLARRDHSDRSVEFWLSLPISHSKSLATPLLVHLVLVPAAALLVGLAGGYALSLVLVSRVAGLDAWLGLPWAQIVAASAAGTVRLLAGLPLATLWLAPLILLVVLMTAWFRRWGWVVLIVGLGLGGALLRQLFGQPLISEVTGQLLQHAAHALVFGGQGSIVIDTASGASGASQALEALSAIPAWALADFGSALQDLATPLLAGGLLFAAGCFALLVQWRQRGAGAAG